MITIHRTIKAAQKHFSRVNLLARAYFGASRGCYCNACGKAIIDFYRYGNCIAWGCPSCGSSPRERLVCSALDNGRLSIPNDARILHVAPAEKSLHHRFSIAKEYIAGDLHPQRYKTSDVVRLDLMDFSDLGVFDLIYASHVLEHVPDDATVLSNMFESIRPGGEVWLLVPLRDGTTEDGPADLSSRERERRFGQWDHLRWYGTDFADRIETAGFLVDRIQVHDFPEELRIQVGLCEEDVIFRGVKPT